MLSSESALESSDDNRQNSAEAVASTAAAESKLSAISELLGQTAEQAERAREKEQRKADNMSTFGWQAFTVEASYKSYEKSLKKLPSGSAPSASAAPSMLEENPLDYGKSNAKVSKHALDRYCTILLCVMYMLFHI